VVVATVDDGEATVKRLRRGAGDIFLQPANPPIPPPYRSSSPCVVRIVCPITSM
jgi:SOS-response transcriptional repressor LexA